MVSFWHIITMVECVSELGEVSHFTVWDNGEIPMLLRDMSLDNMPVAVCWEFSGFMCFLFQFSGNGVMCYVILISSFIIAWIETWFLDFKVLPAEKQTEELGKPTVPHIAHTVHRWGLKFSRPVHCGSLATLFNCYMGVPMWEETSLIVVVDL